MLIITQLFAVYICIYYTVFFKYCDLTYCHTTDYDAFFIQWNSFCCLVLTNVFIIIFIFQKEKMLALLQIANSCN